jgi:cold-inducible RNA-binding protein
MFVIYVDNIDKPDCEADLRALFERYGPVAWVETLGPNETGLQRGFALIDMPDAAEARAAVAGLNGAELHGRLLDVRLARPQESPRLATG